VEVGGCRRSSCAVPLSIVPCQIGSLDAFILRTDKNDRGEGDHQPNVIEIAAEVAIHDRYISDTR
jgi:hypothetical protein